MRADDNNNIEVYLDHRIEIFKNYIKDIQELLASGLETLKNYNIIQAYQSTTP